MLMNLMSHAYTVIMLSQLKQREAWIKICGCTTWAHNKRAGLFN